METLIPVFYFVVPCVPLVVALLIVALRNRIGRAAWIAPLIIGAVPAVYVSRALLEGASWGTFEPRSVISACASLYLIPALAISIVGAATHRRIFVAWKRYGLLIAVFLAAQYAGFWLSTRYLDFVQAAG